MTNNRVHHFKLVLLGDTAVGKSCLVVRFVRDEFFEFQEPTIGGKHLSLSFCFFGHLGAVARACVVEILLGSTRVCDFFFSSRNLNVNCRKQGIIEG